MSTGADLEGSSLKWLDEITSQGNATTARTNKVLAASATRMLAELQGVYAKIQDKGKGQYEAQQLYSRLRNLKDLLPADQQKSLEQSFRADLAKAQAIGGKSGTDLAKILGNTSDTLAKTAAPNVPAINAAGKRLGDFWAKENTAFKDRVTALTQTAAAEGKSWRQLSQQVRELLVLERNAGTESDRSRRINQRLGVAGRADLIARTELQTAFVQGQIARYRETGYDWARWSASAERSCPFCIARDGLVYLLEDVESAIPAHPRCRCSLIPAQSPDDFRNKRFEEQGVDAAESLDDAYWANSRAQKLQQFQRANPKFDDAELRRYARTPTNSQKYLKPGQPAPDPVWAPSGQLIPNLERAIKNAEKAVVRAQAQEQAAKKAEEEAKAAEKKKAEEEAKAAEAERKRLEAETKAAQEAAERLAREKAELQARLDIERLSAAKAKKSEKTKKNRDLYLKDIQKLKDNWKISEADARQAHAAAVKKTKYKEGISDEDLEDRFLIERRNNAQEAAKKYESARNAAKEARREADLKQAAQAEQDRAQRAAASQKEPKKGGDRLKPKEQFVKTKPKPLKSDDFLQLSKADQNKLLSLLSKGRADYYKRLRDWETNKATNALAKEIDGLKYEIGVAVNGSKWAADINSNTPAGRTKLDKALREGWDKLQNPRLDAESLAKWVKDGDDRIAGSVMTTPNVEAPSIAQFQKYLRDIEAAGGNVIALRAMAKMMREQDLLLAWGGKINGKYERETPEMQNDPRAQRFANYYQQKNGALPTGGAYGHTGASSQYVGMNTFQTDEFKFKPSKIDGKESRNLISKHLEELLYRRKVGEDYSAGKITYDEYQKFFRENGGETNWSTSVRVKDRMDPSKGVDYNENLVAQKNMITMLHELGHQVQYWAEYRSQEGGVHRFNGFGKKGELFTKAKLPGGREMSAGTEYSKKNPMEQFAEDWVFYTMDRANMEKLMPKVVKHLDELMEDIFTIDHRGLGPTREQILSARPTSTTTNTESYASGDSNPNTTQ